VSMRPYRFAVALLLAGATSVGADTILLMNGNEVSGSIVDPNADPIVLLIPGGKVSFDLTEIQEIDINDKGFQGKPKEPAEGTDAPLEPTATAPSFADLPAPVTDEERSKRYDTIMSSINVITRSPEEATQEMRDRGDEYIAALGQLGPSVAPQLENTFRYGDVRQAGPMLEALKIADPARAEALAKEAIDHTHPEARAEAIRIVSESTGPDRAQILTKALNDPLPQNRLDALAGIAQTKDPSVALDAAKLLTDASPEVQEQAIAALKAVTGESFTTAAEWQLWANANGAAAEK